MQCSHCQTQEAQTTLSTPTLAPSKRLAHLGVLHTEGQQLAAHAAEHKQEGQVVEPAPAGPAWEQTGSQVKSLCLLRALATRTPFQAAQLAISSQRLLLACGSPEVHPAHHLQRAAVAVPLVYLVLHSASRRIRHAAQTYVA